MAAAGFLYSLVLDGIDLSFKDLSIDDDAPPINTSTKANPDGSTNEGFSSFDHDLATLSFDIDQHVQTPVGLPNVSKGVNNVDWTVSYNGVTLYTGGSVYIQTFSYRGSIPGEGRLRMRFYANGQYS